MRFTLHEGDRKTKTVSCWTARIVGLIGFFMALWLFYYTFGAIPEDPKAIPQAVLIGLMMVGWLVDCLRMGREGIGGLMVLFSGTAFFLFLLYDVLVLRQSKSEGQLVVFAGILILLLAGILFYTCGRNRKKHSN